MTHSTPQSVAPKGIQAAAICTFIFLPLIYISSVFDFVRWPRLLLLQGLTVAMLLAWIVSGRTYRSPAPTIARPMLAFLGWQVLSTLWAGNTIEALLRANQTVAFGAFGLVCAYCLAGPRAIHQVFRAVALALGIVSFICICQYWGLAFEYIPTAGNPSATFGYRNYLATYLVVALPIAAAVSTSDRSAPVRAIAAVVCAASLAALLCTRTRGAWIAGLITVLLFVVGYVRWGGSPILRVFRMYAAPLVLILVSAGMMGLPTSRASDPGQFKIDEQKADALTALQTSFSPSASRDRIHRWHRTLAMVTDHPLFGVGLGGWQFAYPTYDKGATITSNVAPQRPHNDPLWILAETGLIGLLLYAWLIGSVVLVASRIWAAKAENRAIAIACALGVVGYVVHSLFSFPLERVASSALMWFAIASVASLSSEPEGPKLTGIPWPAYLTAAILVVGTGMTTQRLRFDVAYGRAVEAWRRSDWVSVASEAQTAVNIGPYDYRAYQLLGAGYQQTGRYDLAKTAYQTSLNYHQNEGHLPLADLLLRMGHPTGAAEHYRAEAELYPNRIAAHLGLAHAAKASGSWTEVLSSSRRVLALKKDHLDAIALSAEAQSQTGDLVAARATLERLIASGAATAETYTQYGALMTQGNRHAKALNAYLKVVQMTPDDPRAHNNLGTAYIVLGRYSEAVTSFREATRQDITYARAHRNLGDVFEKTGRKREAIAAYYAFVEHWRGAPEHRAWAERRIKTLEAGP